MLKVVDHIGIAVPNIEEALKFWATGLQIEVTHREEVASQKVKTAFLPIGDTNIELLEPTSEDSPIAKAMEKRGPGIHHLCFEVADIHAALKHLTAQGMTLINHEPVPGAHGKLVAFVHPKSTGGILIELSQKM
ncbi:MAG TPA: methylmalonyl-CoA epimerase [bacterium]|nr:methylmalonyl-CoA epimerase [bacterium]